MTNVTKNMMASIYEDTITELDSKTLDEYLLRRLNLIDVNGKSKSENSEKFPSKNECKDNVDAKEDNTENETTQNEAEPLSAIRIAKRALNFVKNENQSLKDEIKTLKGSLQSMEKLTKNMDSDIQNLKKEKEVLNEELSSMKKISSNFEEMKRSLEKENQKLKDSHTCTICMITEIEIVFLPCRHFVTCKKCAHSLKECPICRKTLKNKMKAYLS